MICPAVFSKNYQRMTKTTTFFKHIQKLAYALAIFSAFIQCTEEEMLSVQREKITVPVAADSTKTEANTAVTCADCTFLIPADSTIIDGAVLGLKPGDIIGLSGDIDYGSLEFRNIVGTAEQPIIIRNCGGQATIRATDKHYAVLTIKSKYFRITGGDVAGTYGIEIQGGVMGLNLTGLSTNFEVDHVEISNVGFAGIIAKTDPTCDDATIRGNFTMYDVSLHHNYIHDTGGEGFYVGNSFYDGMDRKQCGKRLPHEIKGLKIFNNIVHDTGWDGIQVGCAIEGTEIHHNEIRNYGTVNRLYQNNGMQISSGTGGLVYNNFIKNGTGNGMMMNGTGDNVIYNNIIVDAGSNGVFVDERYTPGPGYTFVNNTILNPKKDGIRLYSELVPLNTIVNNIIANPGTYSTYSDLRTSEDSFIYRMSSDVNVNMSNNLFVASVNEVQFVDPSKENYRLKAGSPAVNLGKDVAKFRIDTDFYLASRLNGSQYDIGASEF
jgi:D-ribose pyranose/furanose isomerase RbsD